MARSVVNRPSERCPQCRMPPHWCICAGFRAIASPPRIDVLMDHVELWRPSSTGLLVNRIVPGSGRHIYRRGQVPERAAIVQPGKDLWILHPRGGPMPRDVSPADVQVLLLDASWRESGAMLRDVASWGCTVGLPMTGTSRYWLRSQTSAGRFSTIEALAFLLGALGLAEEQAQLSLQLELHVYAGLLARGKMLAAEEYLEHSPVRGALPELAARLARGAVATTKGGDSEQA